MHRRSPSLAELSVPLFITLYVGLTRVASAQDAALPYGPLAGEIARHLQANFGSIAGAWVVDATPTCSPGRPSPFCTFRAPLPENRVIPLLQAVARSLGVEATPEPMKGVLETRIANYERARAAGHATCGDLDEDINLIKIVAVGEMRSAGDTTEALVSVSQFGRIAYCGVGSQDYSFTAIARAGGGYGFRVRTLGHFSGILEIPRKSN